MYQLLHICASQVRISINLDWQVKWWCQLVVLVATYKYFFFFILASALFVSMPKISNP